MACKVQNGYSISRKIALSWFWSKYMDFDWPQRSPVKAIVLLYAPIVNMRVAVEEQK